MPIGERICLLFVEGIEWSPMIIIWGLLFLFNNLEPNILEWHIETIAVLVLFSAYFIKDRLIND